MLSAIKSKDLPSMNSWDFKIEVPVLSTVASMSINLTFPMPHFHLLRTSLLYEH